MRYVHERLHGYQEKMSEPRTFTQWLYDAFARFQQDTDTALTARLIG